MTVILDSKPRRGMRLSLVKVVQRIGRMREALDQSSLSPQPIRPTGLAKSIAARSHKCVAFDIFDTLVARRVTPEHVKLLAADMLSQTFGWSSIDGQTIYRHRQ